MHTASTHLLHRLTWLLLLLAALAACQGPSRPEPAPAIDRLLTLIDQRLAVAPLVAQAKWNSGAPIEDPMREAQILETVARQAAAAGVEEGLAREFFQAQFDASRLIQHRLHAQWRREGRGAFPEAPDLAREVRPQLDRLTAGILTALRECEPAMRETEGRALLAARAQALIRGDFDGEPRAVALRPLLRH